MPARKSALYFSLSFIALIIQLVSCADKKATAPVDYSPPSRIINLVAGNPTDSSMTLQWTSPGDDADTGMAYGYDLRYSIYPLSDSNWSTASKVLGLPLPSLAGYLEEFTITGLAAATRYFFAIKAVDETPQWSLLSNVATARTSGTAINRWSELGEGLNSSAESMTLFNDKLIVGGTFMEAGGIMANHIAAWDDSAWSNLGQGIGGMGGSVMALISYNNSILAATRSGGPNVSIMAWDGESWQPFGTGFNNIVRCMIIYNGNLIVGGDFNAKNSLVVNHIAAWDGSNWMPLGDGVDGGVEVLFVYNNQLIAGGNFDRAGDIDAERIASWDGTSWSALGLGISGGMRPEVSVMTEFNGRLIVAGLFSRAGGIDINNIAAWDGVGWSALGSGTNTAVSGLVGYRGLLMVGGDFTTAGGYPVNRIASWDGTNWGPLDNGLNGDVNCLIVYNDKLIACGNFEAAGDLTVNHIAAWSQASLY
jgi:hypothetical protein